MTDAEIRIAQLEVELEACRIEARKMADALHNIRRLLGHECKSVAVIVAAHHSTLYGVGS